MFRNREEAGERLAQRLRNRPLRDPLVLAIPRGGVIVGAALARALNADLDVVLTRKLRAPGQPELALGAVSEDGQVYLNPSLGEVSGWMAEYLEEEKQFQLELIARRRRLFRRARPAAPIAGRSVLVTDDGIATGSTMIAALKVLRAHNPHELIVAVPVGSPDRLAEVRKWCDDVVCLVQPEDFLAIGQFYEDFSQVEDSQVIDLLEAFAPAETKQ
jgi:hypothetical protein